MDQTKKRAISTLADADKKLTSFSWFNRTAKYEDTADLYIKASDLFKQGKNWKEAGDARVRACDCYLKINCIYDAASNYAKAGILYKNVDVDEAITCFREAIFLFNEEGRFNMSAKYQNEIAEALEAEGDIKKCIEEYEKAADIYQGEGSSTANKCLLKVATYSAELGDYGKAASILESIASDSKNNELLKFSARKHLFNAGLCVLCDGDIVASRRALDRYLQMFIDFEEEREFKFLEAICDAQENFHVGGFNEALQDYLRFGKLSHWQSSLLSHIKELCQDDHTEESFESSSDLL
eukprot:TRINITY_DN10558_c0_g1_i1.p1 TRINITY_DN10558_c0_g1~~TRINITY_DN10558_c0_g1_i1.p1  ORF type:complete len:296 (-),score=69.99 TRINITY_DN10558_c0_g1_i1:40-927(-)